MSTAFSVCLLVLFVLAAVGAPIAISMIVAAIAYLAMKGQDLGLAGEQMMQGLYDSFVLLAVPLFIVAANIMNAGTISERLLKFCVALVGHFRGGLGLVNIVANMIFSGMSGSAVADAAGLGPLVIGMMTKEGRYSRGYSAAITAAAATIGPIIPPSIPMVLYALISNTSIGYLFLGGILPGLLMGFVLMVMNHHISKKRGFAVTEKVALSELPRLTREAFPALMMPVILLYGIYGGITTPTEAAAVAAAYALIMAALFYRALSWRSLYTVLSGSARSSAAVGLIICGALVFNYIVASENLPGQVAGLLGGLTMSPLGFLIGVNILFLLLGCILDSTTIILVIVPLFIPAARQLGVDLVHFGVVVVVNTMIGFITPPYGVLLFVVNATTGIPLREMISEIGPFILALVVALFLMVFFPAIVLWVPHIFGYIG
ncbi:TRAP transporter large permease [Rhodoferax sp.]|uniref:TRAP transporter large permease n=1 Tax=Rhodoferax sp. TaxID=50421 RepID=UPI0027276A59|nr:TRAP transporter large permease [Rhodoferax sp.]MDO8319421.1 TRAP transporter large permease [Rhodoferax sp.]